MPRWTREAEKISQLNPMLARSSITMSPFLQLRMVLRPTNTPLPIWMPWLSVPLASRQHRSSITTLSPMWILWGCRSVTLTPNTTLRPTDPSSIGYNFERSNRPSAPGTQLARTITSSYWIRAQVPGRPTNSSRYLSAFDRFSLNSSCWMTVIRGSFSRGGRTAISGQPRRRHATRVPRESRRSACPGIRSTCAPLPRRAGRRSPTGRR